MALVLRAWRVPDPGGHRPGLRLKGDWVVLELSDGEHAGLGEVSHSGNDDACIARARSIFEEHVRDAEPGPRMLDGLPAADFVTATAISGLDQALHELVARRLGVPVWRLHAETTERESVPLYTTVNRALESRTRDDYRRVFELANDRGFRELKCAPFEQVTRGGETTVETAPGLEMLEYLRAQFPHAGIRIDLHARFTPSGFLGALPALERVRPTWIEEPCELGSGYAELREHMRFPLAAGELFFGLERFEEIAAGRWADVIMPDVKHVGGFGRLVDACRLAGRGGLEVSPHNPSGPIATLASAHAAAVSRAVTSLEIALDTTAPTGALRELVRDGALEIPDGPGWGLELAKIPGIE